MPRLLVLLLFAACLMSSDTVRTAPDVIQVPVAIRVPHAQSAKTMARTGEDALVAGEIRAHQEQDTACLSAWENSDQQYVRIDLDKALT